MITRILKFLMIAAVAWPAWTTATAQNAFQQQPVEKEVKELLPSKGGDIKEAKAISPAAKESQIKIDFNENQGANVDLSKTQSTKAEKVVKKTNDSFLSRTRGTVVGNAPSKLKSRGPSLKDQNDDGTVFPPSGATIEEWNIVSLLNESSNFQGSYPTVKVARWGNDIYIDGFLPEMGTSWVQGTISGTTITIPSYQIYGYTTIDDVDYIVFFAGLNKTESNQFSISENITFSYDEENGTLTLTDGDYIGNLLMNQSDNSLSIYSLLSNTTLTRRAATVCDGQYVAGGLPIYASLQNYNIYTEMVYPAEKLEAMGLKKGDKINAITFYSYPPNDDSSDWNVPSGVGTAKYRISVGETTDNVVTSSTISTHYSGTTTVYNGTLPTGAPTMTITFTTPYTYTGDNLIVFTYVSTTGTSTTARWIVDAADTGAGMWYYNSNNSGQMSYLPKMTINFTPFKTRKIEVMEPEAWNDEIFDYDWKDNNGGTHSSKITDTATDPDQIIAMITKVYTTPQIPGNLKRGFTELGADEPYNTVNYAGVGTIIDDNNTLKYSPEYGWNIPGTLKSGSQAAQNSNNEGTFRYWYMDSTQYQPNKEGVTLLLVELVDDFNNSDVTTTSTASTPYGKLRDYISKSIKSVKLITGAKRTGEGLEAGTLFKIDCDKMNKFYLMAKGQLRWLHNSYWAEYKYNNTTYNLEEYFCANPCYIYNTDSYNYIDQFYDDRSFQIFYNMFEEFSPVANTASAGLDDIYQSLINMDSFGVEHDCMGVAYKGHEFMMYGKESSSNDCQDVRDLMFFVPDFRMMYWKESNEVMRDNNNAPKYQKFMNYNKAHQPMMGLYVIRQDSITPTAQEDDYYMLQLNWRTNLDDFLPSDKQEFQLYEVVTDENGNQSYQPVYYRDENGNYTDAEGNILPNQSDETSWVPIILIMEAGRVKNYPYVYVERKPYSQQVTYAIQGRDAAEANGKHFLSLQISNRQSYIVPGTDPSEIVLLQDATHYSRFDAQRVRNCYSNKLVMENHVDGLDQSKLTSNTKLFVTRKPQGADSVVVATVTFNPTAKTYTVQMTEQADSVDFPLCMNGSRAGYHVNNPNASGVGLQGNSSWTKSYTVDGNTINLGSLVIFDNFIAAIPADNSHPNGYIYKVTSNYIDESTDGKEAHSNSFRIPVYKTSTQINGSFSKETVVADTVGNLGLPGDVEFDVDVQLSSITEILRYDAYRWGENTPRYLIKWADGDDEQDIEPTGLAGNQGEYYTISMNPGTDVHATGSESVADGSGTATFVDKIPRSSADAEAYVYAPVIETFVTGKDINGAVRTDYNTYGGPLQTAATGKLQVTRDTNVPLMSNYSWTDNGKKYTYYNINLKIDKNITEVPSGYSIYKIRAWRKVTDTSILKEEYSDLDKRKGANVMFEDITYPQVDINYPLGSGNGSSVTGGNQQAHAYATGVFGAQKLRTNEDASDQSVIDALDATFVVRIYFTKDANLTTGNSNAPRLRDIETDADGKYYIVEQEIPFHAEGGNVATEINSINGKMEPVSVKYYNAAGVESDHPFKGVNIVVKQYENGNREVVKVIK